MKSYLFQLNLNDYQNDRYVFRYTSGNWDEDVLKQRQAYYGNKVRYFAGIFK